MTRNWRSQPPSFRCFVDATTARHKITVKENQIEVFRNKPYIRFEVLLQRLKEMETSEEINYATHSFKICHRKREKPVEVWNVNYQIEDNTRLVATLRSNRSINMLMTLIDTVEANLAGKPDTAPLKDSFWRTVSQSMERSRFYDFGPNRSCKEFHTLVVEFENYLDHRLKNSKSSRCPSLPVLFSRLESMRLRPFYFNTRHYQSLEQKKTDLAVKETVDYLLIQTSIASSDVEHRMTLGGDHKDVREEVRSEARKSKSLRRSPKKNRDWRRSDRSLSHKFRPSFESDIDLCFDSTLVEVVLDLQTRAQPYYDWPTIRRMMVNRGFHAYGERYCKKRFNWLINKWIWAMDHFPSAKKANREWPLFNAFMQLDLHPFVDHQTYKATAQMKANFGHNRAFKPLIAGHMTPAYGRAPNQRNWDKNYFINYNYYHNLWSNLSRKYY